MSTSSALSTIYLLPGSWDVTADALGNIAVAAPPYAQAQDIASVCRTFYGEVYYDSTLGIEYDQKILGKRPGLNVFQGMLATAAVTVPGIQSASAVISSFQNRQAKGQITGVTEAGKPVTVAIG